MTDNEKALRLFLANAPEHLLVLESLVATHRKGMAEGRTALFGALASISEELAKHGVIVSSPTSLAAVLDGIDDALRRARNAGIEKVARGFDRRAASLRSFASRTIYGEKLRLEWAEHANEAKMQARDIRAMKEEDES